MNKIISTDVTKHLSCHHDGQVISIYTVSNCRLEQWMESLTSTQSKWVKANKFNAEVDQILTLPDDSGDVIAIVLGLGSNTKVSGIKGLAKLAKRLPCGYYKISDQNDQKLTSIGWALAQYEFDRYKKTKNKHHAVLVLDDEQLLKEVSAIINASTLIRDLINIPACDMGPSHLSAVMKDLSDHYDGKFYEVVDEELLIKGLNTIHAVGRAARDKPRLLEMNWGRKDAPKLTLVGKGVCFDTGGLDIKSTPGMRNMKKDIGGAAHTLGLAQLIMETGLDVRLRVLIPAVENNISADAFRPGDIIKTYKGITVEVENTDSEGRLVLCDALALAAEENPELMIDFATLTGSARIAMGSDIVPFFTGNDDIATSLAEFSEQENDPLWRMPLHDNYESRLKSCCADLRNTGTTPEGGAIVAALFLKFFVDEPQNWIHFDMTAWNTSENDTCTEGGEAMSIRAVFSYLQERFGSYYQL